MILKWITAVVRKEQRDAFSAAQSRWSALSGCPGFLLQVGGWDEVHPTRAGIVGVWESGEAYREFMASRHDPIFRGIGQKGTYERISTALFETALEMPGAAADPVAAFRESAGLRIALCTVREGREDHFREVQECVWSPGMKRAVGMNGGTFARRVEPASPEYLVCTGWRDAASHRAYVEARLSTLREASGADEDLADLEGAWIPLEPSWSVVSSGE